MNKQSLLLFLISLLFLTSCSSHKRIATTQTTQQKLEIQYQQFKGIRYQYGGTDQRGFDCSGFVQTVFNNAFHIQFPRTTKEQSKIGKKVSIKNLKPGDLVVFSPSRRSLHTGIYIGNNEFIHSSVSKGITKSRLDNVYWKKKYKFARRILK